MEYKLYNRALKYLQKIQLPKSTRLLITNLNTILYDSYNQETFNEEVSTDLLKHLLLNISSIARLLSKKNKMIEIFKKDEFNVECISQLIVPIKTSSNISINGCIILINYSQIFTYENIEFAKTIKYNLEFYYNTKNKDIIKKYENGFFKHSDNVSNLLSILDENYKKLYIDKNYKRLEELLYFKTDSLKNSLNSQNKQLLNEILELLEERKQHYAFFALLNKES